MLYSNHQVMICLNIEHLHVLKSPNNKFITSFSKLDGRVKVAGQRGKHEELHIGLISSDESDAV